MFDQGTYRLMWQGMETGYEWDIDALSEELGETDGPAYVPRAIP